MATTKPMNPKAGIPKISGFIFVIHNRLDPNKIAEIKISAPGKTMFAREQCKTFEEATDNAVEALRKQITKHKEKQRGS